jgi:hypothetical protein
MCEDSRVESTRGPEMVNVYYQLYATGKQSVNIGQIICGWPSRTCLIGCCDLLARKGLLILYVTVYERHSMDYFFFPQYLKKYNSE